jgi:hypothetical protein
LTPKQYFFGEFYEKKSHIRGDERHSENSFEKLDLLKESSCVGFSNYDKLKIAIKSSTPI